MKNIIFKNNLSVVRVSYGLMMGLLFLTCQTSGWADEDIDLLEKSTRKSLDKVARQLRQADNAANTWGLLTISGLELVELKDFLNLDYDESVTNLVARARAQLQGSVRMEAQTSLNFGVGLKAGLSPAISAGKPVAADNSVALPATAESIPNEAKSALSSEAVSSGLPISESSIGISERRATAIGFNDKIAERLYKQLLNPQGLGGNKKLLFSVMQVSCNPGVNTRHDYIGEVFVQVSYARTKVQTDISRTPKTFAQRSYGSATTEYTEVSSLEGPSIYAVLPLLDAQNLDVNNSQRFQLALAQALSVGFQAQGIQAAADILSGYAKRQEADYKTRTSHAIVTSWVDKRGFGFRFFPELESAADVTRKKSKAAWTLQDHTFPAVVAVIVDTDQVGNPAPKWNMYRYGVSTRWQPLDNGQALRTPQQESMLAGTLDQSGNDLEQIDDTVRKTPGLLNRVFLQKQAIEATYNRIRIQLAGYQETKNLPKAILSPDSTPAAFEFVEPGTIGEKTEFLLIKGGAIKSSCHIYLGAVELPIVEQVNDIARVKIPDTIRANPSPQTLVVTSTSGATSKAEVYSKPITIARTVIPTIPAIAIQRGDDGKIIGLNFSGDTTGLAAKERLDAIKEILKASEAPVAPAKDGK